MRPCAYEHVVDPAVEPELERLFEVVSGYFGLLAEPTRLKILNAICEGERSVTDIVERVGSSQTERLPSSESHVRTRRTEAPAGGGNRVLFGQRSEHRHAVPRRLRADRRPAGRSVGTEPHAQAVHAGGEVEEAKTEEMDGAGRQLGGGAWTHRRRAREPLAGRCRTRGDALATRFPEGRSRGGRSHSRVEWIGRSCRGGQRRTARRSARGHVRSARRWQLGRTEARRSSRPA